MSSAVFFKFKSQKEPQRVTFDGTGVSVFELKRDIISISRLGDGTDFDLAIYNPDNNEEYDDDTTIISRGTTVVARRLPASRPGAGRAARYVSGKMPVTAKNQHRIEASKTAVQAKPESANDHGLPSNASEEDRIAAMFNQGGEAWEQQQQQMANQKAIHRTGYVKAAQPVPDKPLPAGYTCHRCGEKGHWIQACPTNNDPTFDNRPKFRKTTGIPRSFLKVVEKPAGTADDGSVDVSQLPAGVMYTANGEWVVAEPDKASWDQFQAKTRALAEKAETTDNDKDLEEAGLACPIDKKMFVDPVKTPCCERTYCRECIENALLSSDFVCPGCSTEGVLVDNLVEDEDAVTKCKEFAEALANKGQEEKQASPTPAEPVSAVSTPKKPTAAMSATADDKVDARSPPSAAATLTTDGISAADAPRSPSSTGSKKRPAEDELKNKRVPTAPAAMRAQQVQMPQQMSQQMPQNPQDMNQFVHQMNAMAATMGPQGMNPFMMNQMGFPGMMNPAMMMGMPNPMMMNNMGMGFPQGNNMDNNSSNMMMGGRNGGFNNQQQWQGNQQWNNNAGAGRGRGQWQNQQQGGGGAYMRQPVNPGRYQNRNRNQQQRSVDYRELGS